MAIIVPYQRMCDKQIIKLFSNPVSGIACIYNPNKCNSQRIHNLVKDIRYSKSMILGALTFWSDQLFKFYLKVTKISNPLEPTIDTGNEIMKKINRLQEVIDYIKTVPDSYLFSHRYIQQLDSNKYNDAIKLQLKLVSKECHPGAEIVMQQTKMHPYFYYGNHGKLAFDLSFTVFPNEHPYIRRTVIAEVGQTKNGNTFIIKKQRNEECQFP